LGQETQASSLTRVAVISQGALQLAADALYLKSWFSGGAPVGSSDTVPHAVAECVLHESAQPRRRSSAGASEGKGESPHRGTAPSRSASLLMTSLCPMDDVARDGVDRAFSRLHHAIVLLLSPAPMLKDARVRLGNGGGGKDAAWFGDPHRAAVMAALGCLPDAAAWQARRSGKYATAFQALRSSEYASGRDATLAPLCFGLDLA